MKNGQEIYVYEQSKRQRLIYIFTKAIYLYLREKEGRKEGRRRTQEQGQSVDADDVSSKEHKQGREHKVNTGEGEMHRAGIRM